MRSLFLKSALVLTVVLSWSGVPTAERTAAANGTNPAFKSIGPLAFSPDGVLFAGDTESAAIFALDLGKSATGGAPGAKAIPAFDQKVAALLGAAAHDPQVFARPEELDVGRRPNPHLGFGAGVHYCLGAPLARLEMAAVLDALRTRLPGVTLAEPPRRRPDFVMRGLRELRVTA